MCEVRRGGLPRVRSGGGFRERESGEGMDIVFLEHGDPAGRVPLDHDGFVVGLRVPVGLAGFEDGVDDSEHLVGGGDDGALACPGAP